MTNRPLIEAEVTFLRTEEGGRVQAPPGNICSMTRREAMAVLGALGMSACASTLQRDGGQRGLSETAIQIGRIYATEDGESHIGELEIMLTQNQGRPLFFNSTRFAATAVGFQYVRAGAATAWHNPSQRWLALILSGTWEIEASDGSRRRFPAGSVSLVEDTSGKGHRGRAVGDSDVLVAAVTLGPEERLG